MSPSLVDRPSTPVFQLRHLPGVAGAGVGRTSRALGLLLFLLHSPAACPYLAARNGCEPHYGSLFKAMQWTDSSLPLELRSSGNCHSTRDLQKIILVSRPVDSYRRSTHSRLRPASLWRKDHQVSGGSAWASSSWIFALRNCQITACGFAFRSFRSNSWRCCLSLCGLHLTGLSIILLREAQRAQCLGRPRLER